MAPHRYRLVGFLIGFLVRDCLVGKYESQVGKKVTQVGKIALQVGIEILQEWERRCHPQKRILVTGKSSNKGFYLI
jgi:hypothetical protein